MMSNLITTGIAAEIAAAVAAEMEKHFKVQPTLTMNEAAQELGISVQSMRALCRERKIPAVRLDKSYRIRVVDLNNYLDAHLQTAEDKSSTEGVRSAALADAAADTAPNHARTAAV